jgi:hypothetical protein
MRDDQSSDDVKGLGGSKLAAKDDDSGLITLEVQLDDLVNELLAAQKANGKLFTSSDQRPLVPNNLQAGAEAGSDQETGTKQVEAILARLYPVEQAIMATPARTIAGLGVKARHAAYVMSQHWGEPVDQIDWEAKAVRLLIEAVCEVARTPLSLSDTRQ